MQILTIRNVFQAFEPNSKHTNQICSIRKDFEAFECKFKPFERDSQHLKPNSKHLKGIRSIQIQIRTTWDSSHSNTNFNYSKGIWSIRTKFEAFECKLEPFERNVKCWMEVLTIRNGFEAFECKFEPFKRDSKHSNANSIHSKEIWSIRIQIRTTPQGIRMQIQSFLKGFEAFECQF